MSLPIHKSDVELLVRVVMGTSMVALAEEAGCTPPNISRKVKRIKERLSWSAGMTVEQIRQRAGAVRLAGRSTGPEVLKLIAERDQLKAVNFDLQQGQQAMEEEITRLQRFETAYKEFIDKTDWVVPDPARHELGMHVADILRKRCDDLTSHNQAQADEIVRLRAIETFEDAVACVFDNLKYSAANTDDKAWDERLEDLAEDVIEYAPRYKKQWKDIIKLSREKDSLRAENESLIAAMNEILRVTPMGVEAFGIAALVIGELGVTQEPRP